MKIIDCKFNIFAQTFDLEIEGCDCVTLVTCRANEIEDIILDFEIENPEILFL